MKIVGFEICDIFNNFQLILAGINYDYIVQELEEPCSPFQGDTQAE